MRLLRFSKQYKLKDYRFGLITLVLALSILGVLVVGSAKQALQGKQIFGVIVGVTIMLIISVIDYVWVLNFYWLIYGAAVGSLLGILFFTVSKFTRDKYS